MCHEPATCVILSSTDGKILDALPIGSGTDGGGFNPNTMEAFSSQRDGTLTIIKESSPTSFAVEQNVKTHMGARTCSLDTQKNQIVLIALDRAPAPAGATPAIVAAPPSGMNTNNAPDRGRRGGRGGFGGPGILNILVVGQVARFGRVGLNMAPVRGRHFSFWLCWRKLQAPNSKIQRNSKFHVTNFKPRHLRFPSYFLGAPLHFPRGRPGIW